MPTYDYVCDACSHEFEEFQSITEPLLRKCPACKKLKLRRLFGTGAAVVFKGSGFYETDYRSESYKAGAEKDKPKTDKTEKSEKSEIKSADTASETKKETKPETKPKNNKKDS